MKNTKEIKARKDAVKYDLAGADSARLGRMTRLLVVMMERRPVWVPIWNLNKIVDWRQTEIYNINRAGSAMVENENYHVKQGFTAVKVEDIRLRRPSDGTKAN